MLAAPMPIRSAPTGTAPPSSGARALAGRFAALDEQAKTLEPVVRALLAHVLRASWSDADVHDACHEVFRRALEGRERWVPCASIRPWLLGIARHVALDVLRSRHRTARRAMVARDREGPDAAELLERIADPMPGPDAVLVRAEQRARVEAAMDGLAAEPRRALELFHLEGLGYREIAERMGVPLGTVCTWILRARRQLAVALMTDAPGPSGSERPDGDHPARGERPAGRRPKQAGERRSERREP